MTPYAVMLVKPNDGDVAIRKRFQMQSKKQHPDRDGANGQPGPEWFSLAAAYSQIKTEGLRAAWAAKNNLLSRLCKPCSGLGVRGTRIGGGKITVCDKCSGEGRLVK